MTARAASIAASIALGGALGACEAPGACEEDPRAQVLDERVEVVVDGQRLLAELADDEVERERGWRHRRCEREALLLVPASPPEPLPIWGCGLAEPIDALFIAGGQLLALERIEPCPEPCGACPISGEGLEVDAVLELPLDSLDPEPGDAIEIP